MKLTRFLQEVLLGILCLLFVGEVSCKGFPRLRGLSKLVITLPQVPSPYPPPSSPPPPSPPPLSPGIKPPRLNPPPPPTNNGECAKSPPVYIYASTEADLYSRLKYSPATTVWIFLKQDITLSNPFMMDGGFSCTSIRSYTPGTPKTIKYPGEDAPTIFMMNTNNIFLYEVNVETAVSERSPNCKDRQFLADYNGKNICGAIHMWKAWAIKIYQGSVNGRIDVLRSSRVHLDGLTVFAASNMYDLRNNSLYGSPAVVRYMYCGDNKRLVRSNNILSNSEIIGGYLGVLIMLDSVGVTVRNNDIHNFTFTAIQCGQNVQNAADCMLSTFSHNYIYTESWVPFNADGAGIYFDTHWINPGNYITCNYIKGGRQCIYLDYVSSGVRLDGGVCYNTNDGNKINTGKNNKITNLLFYNLTYASTRFTCINWFQNNCNFFPGSVWASKFYAFFNTAPWLEIAPYLKDLCEKTSINGYDCNPPNATGQVSNRTQSGNCSGFPTENELHSIVIDSTRANKAYIDSLSCGDVPYIQNVNIVKAYNVSSATYMFNDINNEDFGVDNFGSPIYARFPKFKSCPRAAVGIQKKLYTPWWKSTLETTYKNTPSF